MNKTSLVNPVDNYVSTSSAVVFSWNKIFDTTTYNLQVSSTANFSIIEGNYQINSTVHSTTGWQDNKQYFWRVRPLGGTFSEIRSFEVFRPELLAPLELWLKSDSGIIASNDSVSLWKDLSGNGNDAVQNTASLRPVRVLNSIYDKPALYFDGAGDFLQLTNKATLESSYSVISLHKRNFNTELLSALNNADGGYLFYQADHSAGGDFHNLGFTIPSSFYIESLCRDGVNAARFENGNLDGGSNLFSTSSAFSVRRIGGESGYTLQGKLAELFLYDTMLTASQRTTVEQYLRCKYSPAVNLGPDSIITYRLCDTITLSAGRSFLSYLWSTGETTSSILASSLYSKKYWVAVVDSFGFSSSDTIELVTAKNKLHFGNLILCSEDTIAFNPDLGPSYSYLWQDNSIDTAIKITQPGKYWVTITDSYGCSETSDTLFVAVDSFPSVVSLGSDTGVCSGASISLISGGSQAVSYLWSPGSTTNPSLVVTSSNTYIVNVQDINGCTGSDTISVSVKGVSPAVDFLFADKCLGSAIAFTDVSSVPTPDSIAAWAWNFGDGATTSVQNPTHSYSLAGTYTVSLTVISDSGCVNSASETTIVYPKPSISFSTTATPEACIGLSYSFVNTTTINSPDGLESLLWDFGDATTSTVSPTSHSYSSAGTPTVGLTLVTQKGCTVTASAITSVHPIDTIPKAFSLISPAMQAVFTDTFVDFSWNPSLYASIYKFQLSTDSFATISSQITGLITQTSISGLAVGTKYYWRVIAYNVCRDSVVSLVRSFTIFSPGNIPGLVLWLLPERGVDTVASGAVSQWRDQSSLNNNSLQTVVGSRPFYTGAIGELNGFRSVSFDGVDDFMSFLQPLPLMTSTVAVNIFSVIRPDTTGRYPDYAGGGLLREYPGGEVPGSWYVGVRNTGSISMNHHSIAGPDPSGVSSLVTPLVKSMKPAMAEWVWNGVKDSILISGQGGVLQKSNTNGGWGAGNGELGRGFSFDPAAYYKGDVSEILVATGIMSDSLRWLTEQYLRYKYAPPVNLGPDISIAYGVCPRIISARKGWFDSYQWNTGSTADSVIVSSSGPYAVTVKDVFGFPSTDTVNVITPGNFNPLFGNNVTICAGKSLIWNTQLDHVGYDFLWSDGTTDSLLVITQAGIYSVTVTDTVGCSRTSATVTVTVDNFPLTASLGSSPTTMCAGSSISLLSGAGPGVSYVWSPGGATTSSLTINQTGISSYTLLAINSNGCAATPTLTVNVKGVAPTPKFTAPAACAGSAMAFIDSSSVPSPDSIAVWSWTFGDGDSDSIQNPAHTYTGFGTYSVTLAVTSDSGCTASIQKVVTVHPVPSAGLSVTSPICTFDPANFSDMSSIVQGANTGFFWDFGDGGSSVIKNISHSYSLAGTYTVQHVVISDKGCKDTATTTVNVLASPSGSFTADTVCQGNPTHFTGSAASTWLWNFGDGSPNETIQNPQHVFTTAGSHTVTLFVTGPNGCTNASFGVVQVNHLPIADFTGDSACVNNPLQFGDASSVTGSTITGWDWSFGNGDTSIIQNPSATYSAAGTYTVTLTATSAQGCAASATHTVVALNQPVAGFTFTPGFIPPQQPVSFTSTTTGASSYQWSFGDGSSTSSLPNPSHTYTATGTYLVQLIAQSAFGCADTFSIQISVDIPLLDMGITDILANNLSGIVQVTANLENFGTLDATSIELSAYLDDGTPVHELWSGLIKPDSTKVYTFLSSFELVNNKHSVVCVEIKKVNGMQDDVSSNNKKCTALTDEFTLLNPFPNPTGGDIWFLFVTPEASHLLAEVLDARGRVVATPFDGDVAKGLNQLSYSTLKLEKAMYWIKLTYQDKVAVKPFMKE